MTKKLGDQHNPFDRDIAENEGYRYTTHAGLSSILANRRLTELTLAIEYLPGKAIIDIGCGDGTYTVELYDLVEPKRMVGIDPAEQAIATANKRKMGRKIEFLQHEGEVIPFADDSFDVAQLRGILHHALRPVEVLAEALRVAPRVIIIEPNGYNPIVKCLERISRYHRQHHEKSYMPHTIAKWCRENNARILRARFGSIVPFFCPERLAKLLKMIEPLTEKHWPFNALFCAVIVFSIVREKTIRKGRPQ